ncbi:MAG: hypothetical protein NZ895_02260 [Archaeoglobaceae archaeon]|nr:hypothetical protein [Archaeoglobaceae archaeon]MCX8152183.1 DUF166 family protein [Archaeoglobaceae archaeon]MDW8013899.1 DUF166 family protein [Archaeoglobaceae archaeon]
MQLIVFENGFFGERFIANLMNYPNSCPSFGACGIDRCTQCKQKLYSFTKNIVAVYAMPDPKTMPRFLEDASDYLPKKIADADVAVAINVHPDILIELPKALEGKVSGLIVPVEEPRWCQPGLRKQLSEKCENFGIEFSSPKPFCSFKPKKGIMKKFYEYFSIGYPVFEIEVSEVLENIRVLKSQPCGAAWYIRIKLLKFKMENIRELWNLISEAHHSFPCTASMEKDVEYNDTLLHVAGYIARHSIDSAIGYEGDEDIPQNLFDVVLNDTLK